MKIGIMQPYFVPYIGYWQLMHAVDKYVVMDDVSYIKRGWINRNRILINGEARYINIPICDASQNRLIKDTYISNEIGWDEKNLKTIQMAYRRAPYFDRVYPIIERMFRENESSIARFNLISFYIVNEYLGLQQELILQSSLKGVPKLKGQNLIIQICKQFNASEYYNAIGGQKLYSYSDFKANGIKLSFVKPNDIHYKQFENIFQPNLSIIDVLMFNDVNTVKDYLSDYSLIESRE